MSSPSTDLIFRQAEDPFLVENFNATDPDNWEKLKQALTEVLPDRLSTETEQVQHEVSEDSSAEKKRPQEVDLRAAKLFARAVEEDFEDGMESDFSRGLIWFVEKYGNDAVMAIAGLIIYEKCNAEVASEALRWLGRIRHPESYNCRLWLLEKSLTHSSPRVRDGAVLGLASADDTHAIPHLRKAIQSEECPELREDMKEVLAQLEATAECPTS